MRRALAIILLVLISSVLSSANSVEFYEKTFQQARSLKNEAQLSKLIKDLENLIYGSNNPDKEEFNEKELEKVKVILSETYFEYSEILLERQKKEELLRKSLELSEDILKFNQQNGRAYYVASMCSARLIDFVNVFGKLNLLNKFDAYIDNAIRYSNDYIYKGLSFMAKAVRYMSAPWPFGDTKKALENFKEAEKYIGDYSGVHLYLAEIYLKLGDKKSAENSLRMVLNLQPHPYFLVQHETNVKVAQQILQNLK
ncbi:tetratricopeptide repeat protein [Fervidobacterium gondwanense]|uniref:Tetratricopeptide repeat-containing protein n=1 Tax=Fervidobacterium gondwanense DSM 13020 TaxID=1121883 RepID=A0A1M7SJV0_FERGO|nr:tetratricopeptide repeat protein [Fervidobacterium gondwanense]SHN58698.1 Tetratricopeptide repeat-containing protein [Fervidobacterium gondwanense DSM 13020]